MVILMADVSSWAAGIGQLVSSTGGCWCKCSGGEVDRRHHLPQSQSCGTIGGRPANGDAGAWLSLCALSQQC